MNKRSKSAGVAWDKVDEEDLRNHFHVFHDLDDSTYSRLASLRCKQDYQVLANATHEWTDRCPYKIIKWWYKYALTQEDSESKKHIKFAYRRRRHGAGSQKDALCRIGHLTEEELEWWNTHYPHRNFEETLCLKRHGARSLDYAKLGVRELSEEHLEWWNTNHPNMTFEEELCYRKHGARTAKEAKHTDLSEEQLMWWYEKTDDSDFYLKALRLKYGNLMQYWTVEVLREAWDRSTNLECALFLHTKGVPLTDLSDTLREANPKKVWREAIKMPLSIIEWVASVHPVHCYKFYPMVMVIHEGMVGRKRVEVFEWLVSNSIEDPRTPPMYALSATAPWTLLFLADWEPLSP